MLLNDADAIFLGSTAVDRVYLAGSIVWPPAFAQWSTVYKHSGLALSNNDRTCAGSSVGNRSVMSIAPLLQRSYWEINIDNLLQNMLIGVAIQGQNVGITGPTANQGIGTYYQNNGLQPAPLNVSWGTGDRLGFAYDPENAALWIRKNGTWLGSDPSGVPALVITHIAFGSGRIFVPYAGFQGISTVTLISDPALFGAAAPAGYEPLTNEDFPKPRWSLSDRNQLSLLSEAQTKFTKVGTTAAGVRVIEPAKGKQLWAIQLTADGAGSTLKTVGLTDQDDSLGAAIGNSGFSVGYRSSTGAVVANNATLKTYSTWGTVGDILMLATDGVAKKWWLGLNGVWNGDPAAGTGDVGTWPQTGSETYGFVSANATDTGDQFKLIDWPYAVPSGFEALVTNTVEVVELARFNGGHSNATGDARTNLTITHSNTTGNAGAWCYAPKNTGKWYFEVTVNQSTGLNDGSGLLAGPGTLVNFGSGTNSVSVKLSGAIRSNGVDTGVTLGAIAASDIIQWAVDLDADLFWVRKNAGNWNNNVSADPATGVGGLSCSSFASTCLFPVVGFGGTGTLAGDNMTFNFGQNAFAHTVPSGFYAGWTK